MMAHNTSTAVMARRHQPAGDLDFFPTPPWATRALFGQFIGLGGSTVWEPACGRGHMARPLAEYADRVHASDIAERGYGEVFDFLALDGLGLAPSPFGPVDWIVTNPPFDQLQRFLLLALSPARIGVAMFGRLQLLEGAERYASIFHPYAGQFTIYPFVERVPIEEGCCAPDTSTASAYCWLVINKIWVNRKPLAHIPPCRRQLEREGDYDSPEFIARVRAQKEARDRARKDGAA